MAFLLGNNLAYLLGLAISTRDGETWHLIALVTNSISMIIPPEPVSDKNDKAPLTVLEHMCYFLDDMDMIWRRSDGIGVGK